MAKPWDQLKPGDVKSTQDGGDPPISSLVEAFAGRPENATDAIVLRGYLGRSDIFRRAHDYLETEKKIFNAGGKDPGDLKTLIKALNDSKAAAEKYAPWRLYLSPRLDRYVDFHRHSLLAYRMEPKAERFDACTIWLRAYEEDGRSPVLYRVAHETTIGPSYAAWLGGQVVDDYADQSSSSTAWGNQSGTTVGNHPWTTAKCGE